MAQQNSLRLLKLLGTKLLYSQPVDHSPHYAHIMVFSDSGRVTDHGQLFYVSGLLVNYPTNGAIFYTLSWSSHESKKTVKITDAAEIIAAGELSDEGRVLCDALQLIIDVKLTSRLPSKENTRNPLCLRRETRSIGRSVLFLTSFSLILIPSKSTEYSGSPKIKTWQTQVRKKTAKFRTHWTMASTFSGFQLTSQNASPDLQKRL